MSLVIGCSVLLLLKWRTAEYEHNTFDKPLGKAKVAFEKGDYDEVRRLVEPLARTGYYAAQWDMALLYALGRGIGRDDEEALKLIKLSTIGTAKFVRENDTCKELDIRFAANVFSFAKELEQMGEKKNASNWFNRAAELGYDPQKCPRK